MVYNPLEHCISYFDLLSANPCFVSIFVAPRSETSIFCFSPSIFESISNASNIANFFVAAAFFNLSAASSSSGSGFIISSLATLISCYTACIPACIILSLISFVSIIVLLLPDGHTYDKASLHQYQTHTRCQA